jgi:hypothetical protein
MRHREYIRHDDKTASRLAPKTRREHGELTIRCEDIFPQKPNGRGQRRAWRPRLAVIASIGGDDFAERLMQARSAKV